MIRAEYVKECSTLLAVEEAMLYHQINLLKSSDSDKTITRTQHNAPVTPAPNESAVNVPTSGFQFENEERNILQLLIRYGQQIMFYNDEAKSQPVKAGNYIIDELSDDNISFFNPLHQSIIDEYKMHREDELFIPEKYFLYHPDEKISQLTADLVTEKYTLSKVHSKIKKIETDSERLIELIPRVIFEFKNSLIIDQIRQKLREMKNASDLKNESRISELMQELAVLEGFKKQLSKTLGERIIIKI